jgi:4'-phosphopantetheinyl transferase
MSEPPPTDEVHVDVVDPGDTRLAARCEGYAALLAPDERARMARLVFERDRRRFLITRALVRTLLSRYASVPPADWEFVTTEYGRPEIVKTRAGVPDLRFNVSHTEGLIACAVTVGREVGVDVEHVGRHVSYDVAGRFFTPREVASLRARPEAERARVFFDYWTLKEAYIKARGLGLALPLGDFAFTLAPPAAPSIGFEPAIDDDPTSWQFVQAWVTPAHRLGLAVRRRGADLPVRIRHVVPEMAA